FGPQGNRPGDIQPGRSKTHIQSSQHNNYKRNLRAAKTIAQVHWRKKTMATSPSIAIPQKPLEDPLAHLPCSSIVEYRKGQIIYNQDQPSTSIFLVIDGKI